MSINRRHDLRSWAGLTGSLASAMAPLSCLLLPNVVVVEVAFELLHADFLESGLADHLDRLLLTPHGAKAGTTVSEGNRHAVHGRHTIKARAKGMIDVVFEVARRC